MDSMEQQIIDALEDIEHIYIKIETQESIEVVHKLFVNEEYHDDSQLNDIELFYYGVFHQFINIQHHLMKKYYLMAIEHGHPSSMVNMGYYYRHIEDYDLMKKYYLMGIQHDNVTSMANLAYYYYEIEKDYDLMKKYFLMAIKHGSSMTMNNLGYYYQHIEKNYDLMKKYYLMAIDNGDSKADSNLKIYYDNAIDDYSFLDLFNEPKFKEKVIEWINGRFEKDAFLSKENTTVFWRLNFDNRISRKIRMKQYILKKTGVFPLKYNDEYVFAFMELVLLSSSPTCIFYKDVMMTIASFLFV